MIQTPDIRLEITADGSPTLYREDIDEHYHSVKGALAESLHVYIDMCWGNCVANRVDNCEDNSDGNTGIRVFEVGFGTGLNAALTAESALSNQIHTEYFSIELFPLNLSAIEQILPTIPDKYRSLLRKINEAEWDAPVNINPYFSLTKINGNLLDCELPTGIDAVYFDAFAPDKQPEMWSVDIFQKLYDAMSPAATMTTYCAKGAIRRMLNMIGFTTQRLPGPPNGKREILRAIKPSQTPDNKE